VKCASVYLLIQQRQQYRVRYLSKIFSRGLPYLAAFLIGGTPELRWWRVIRKTESNF
jgi:hypothetical protein